MPSNCDKCDKTLDALINAHGKDGTSHDQDEPCTKCDKLLGVLGRQHENMAYSHES